jgi:hypothetical protein
MRYGNELDTIEWKKVKRLHITEMLTGIVIGGSATLPILYCLRGGVYQTQLNQMAQRNLVGLAERASINSWTRAGAEFISPLGPRGTITLSCSTTVLTSGPRMCTWRCRLVHRSCFRIMAEEVYSEVVGDPSHSSDGVSGLKALYDKLCEHFDAKTAMESTTQ